MNRSFLPKTIVLALTGQALLFLMPDSGGWGTEAAADRPADMQDWREQIFNGSTVYRTDLVAGEAVLLADATASASALYQSRRIDLQETPYLHWRWRIEKTFGADVDERTAERDDFPARVYVVRRGGLAFWRTRAINYVWSSGRPAGTRWSNPFAGDNVQMWSLDSGENNAGLWQTHVRDVRADWLAAFGEEIDKLDGLAIMTDSDNSGAAIRAWYADIRFSDRL